MPIIQEEIQEDTEEPPPRASRCKRKKWFRIAGCLQFVGGVTTVAISLASGGLLIPIIIGGYFIGNGLLNFVIKV